MPASGNSIPPLPPPTAPFEGRLRQEPGKTGKPEDRSPKLPLFRKHSLPVLALTLCLGTANAPAAGPAKHGHSHHGSAAKPTLDNGKKWAIDEPLRKAMGNIRDIIAASLGGIHEGKLSDSEYGELAGKINGEVEYMAGNCKLDPKADAQLHLILADMLEGIGAMQGKLKKVKRRDGAVKVVGALEKYATYFDDSGWKPLTH
ncbi:MAG: hypothetical protein HZC43_00795 [Nitrosomonadales bacterium]|nr:hypothetical protein [Nitrosomonadales bacterium]